MFAISCHCGDNAVHKWVGKKKVLMKIFAFAAEQKEVRATETRVTLLVHWQYGNNEKNSFQF